MAEALAGIKIKESKSADAVDLVLDSEVMCQSPASKARPKSAAVLAGKLSFRYCSNLVGSLGRPDLQATGFGQNRRACVLLQEDLEIEKSRDWSK